MCNIWYPMNCTNCSMSHCHMTWPWHPGIFASNIFISNFLSCFVKNILIYCNTGCVDDSRKAHLLSHCKCKVNSNTLHYGIWYSVLNTGYERTKRRRESRRMFSRRLVKKDQIHGQPSCHIVWPCLSFYSSVSLNFFLDLLSLLRASHEVVSCSNDFSSSPLQGFNAIK